MHKPFYLVYPTEPLDSCFCFGVEMMNAVLFWMNNTWHIHL